MESVTYFMRHGGAIEVRLVMWLCGVDIQCVCARASMSSKVLVQVMG